MKKALSSKFSLIPTAPKCDAQSSLWSCTGVCPVPTGQQVPHLNRAAPEEQTLRKWSPQPKASSSTFSREAGNSLWFLNVGNKPNTGKQTCYGWLVSFLWSKSQRGLSGEGSGLEESRVMDSAIHRLRPSTSCLSLGPRRCVSPSVVSNSLNHGLW